MFITVTIITHYTLASARPEIYRHLQRNTLKVASVKWMKLDCVVPVLPLELTAHSVIGRSRPESGKPICL